MSVIERSAEKGKKQTGDLNVGVDMHLEDLSQLITKYVKIMEHEGLRVVDLLNKYAALKIEHHKVLAREKRRVEELESLVEFLTNQRDNA